ncbi:protein GLUTAMINE DUMPER 1-like [Impatiens glandulifera]|uniref:protein GLUTAMINE DUMPER 1-like n=1 Tax=Impatiens glandulifera TaxID=253017 RepID=UPI001FB0A02F|nr:protein GLUTAMINE DUMPER 1-like [Impatiens glandulifera]
MGRILLTLESTSTFYPPAPATAMTWHTPFPYLFMGLAAMLGLISFALLIMSCIYFELNSSEEEISSRDDHNGEMKTLDGDKGLNSSGFEERILVIMAGEVKPSFLATPAMFFKSDKVSFGS